MNENTDLIEYNTIITTNIAEADDGREFDHQVAVLCEHIQRDVAEGKPGMEEKLLKYIRQYPKEPAFRNYLSVLYHLSNENEKASSVNRQLLIDFPNYVYGRLNLANERIHRGEFDNMEDLFGDLLEIHSAFPDRKVFHIGEVWSYYETLLKYLIGKKDWILAINRLRFMDSLKKKFPDVTYLNTEPIFDHLFFEQLREGIKIEEIPIPTLRNKLMYELYCNTLRIDHDLVQSILKLPEEDLIADLRLIIRNGIAKTEDWMDMVNDPRYMEHILHALAIASELKTPLLLPDVLALLSAKQDHLDFWLNDFITEDTFKVLYNIGNTRLPDLFEFILKEDVYIYSRAAASTAISLVAYLQPHRRQEVLNGYSDLLSKLLCKSPDIDIDEKALVEYIISDLTNIQGFEIQPLILQTFDKFHDPSNFVFDSREQLISELQSRYQFPENRLPYKSIFEFYDTSLSKWHFYKTGNDLLAIENIRNGFTTDDYENEDEISFDDEFESSTPFVKPMEPGRNDPCYCGSGKKYKKCCMLN